MKNFRKSTFEIMISLQECSLFLRTINSTSCSKTSNIITDLWSKGKKSDIIQWSSNLDENDEEYLDPNIICEFIEDCIEKKGFCMISINLETEEMILSNLEHVFTIVKLENKAYKIESYLDRYNPRIVEFSNFYDEMMKLLLSFKSNNKIFTDEWNKLFSVNEFVPDSCIYNVLHVEILYLVE